LIGKFFAGAEQKFKEADIAANRVDIIIPKREARAGKMILKEAIKGN
jgi:hypothetical protein